MYVGTIYAHNSPAAPGQTWPSARIAQARSPPVAAGTIIKTHKSRADKPEESELSHNNQQVFGHKSSSPTRRPRENVKNYDGRHANRPPHMQNLDSTAVAEEFISNHGAPREEQKRKLCLIEGVVRRTPSNQGHGQTSPA